MNFDTSVDDMVGLVVDREHSRYGQICKLEYHDWKDFGQIGVIFGDGSREGFYDGIVKGDKKSKLRRFYRIDDEKGIQLDSQDVGPRSFQNAVQEERGTLDGLIEDYEALFSESLPQFQESSSSN